MNTLKSFIKKEIVLVISLVLAVVSIFMVPIDSAYAEYIDFRTLGILFCLMVIMAGLQKLNIFRQIGEGFIQKVSSFRVMSVVLTLLCFFFSMFITNDVALLTFVPFTIIVLNLAEKSGSLLIIVILETIAANLGSMMMPMGNPQNLYLYSLTDLSLIEFIMLMLPYGALSLVMLIAMCIIFIPKESISLSKSGEFSRTKQEKFLILVYLLLFVVSLLTVSRIIDFRINFGICLLMVLLLDRKILGKIDYSLLFTFTFLFIFIGNLKRIPAVNELLSGLVLGREILTSIIASQFISNVPAAILLSGFTKNYNGLIVGTNLGGLGTLIASMASLISFKLYSAVEGTDKKTYIIRFSLINFVMLIILYLVTFIIRV